MNATALPTVTCAESVLNNGGLLLVAHDVVLRELPPDWRHRVVVDEARRGGLDARFLDGPPIHEDPLDHQRHSCTVSGARVDENRKVGRIAGGLQKRLDGRGVERHRVDRKDQILHSGGFGRCTFRFTLSAAREVDHGLDTAFLQRRHRHLA